MSKVILTGDRPTGRLHVGHYVGSLKRRVELQNSGEYDKVFIMIADAQALTDNADNPEKVRQNVIEVALDYMACGLDPAKSTLFIQSQIAELCELSFYYMNLVTVSRLQKRLQVSYLFISHDIGVVNYMADRIAVMFHGKLIEQGTAKEVLTHPKQIYTQQLLNSSFARRVPCQDESSLNMR